MVGSFEIFRKYQRSLLVAVAILAMLAFFVLPPFLQMGSSTGSQDPVAVTWTGGELREGGLERTVALRSLVNRFLMEAAEAAGRGPLTLAASYGLLAVLFAAWSLWPERDRRPHSSP